MDWWTVLEMAKSRRLFLVVLPDSRELKWSWPSVRFKIFVPFFDRFTINRFAVAWWVFSFGI